MVGRTVANPRYTSITITFSEAEVRQINEWIERQQPKPLRSVAIRELAMAGLKVAIRSEVEGS